MAKLEIDHKTRLLDREQVRGKADVSQKCDGLKASSAKNSGSHIVATSLPLFVG